MAARCRIPVDVADRRDERADGGDACALVARIAAQGGQSSAYYIQVALALGYTITITEFQTAQFGVSTFGLPFYSNAWANAWQVNAPSVA